VTIGERLRRNPSLRRMLLFLSIMGPGIITANVDNDAGGITTYSLAGAEFGYGLIWTLIPIMVALVLVQETCNRMGVVTGKGLSDLIRERFGVRITFYLMLLILVTNFGNIVGEFAGIAAAFEIFGLNRAIFVPIAAFLVWYMVVKGTYRSVEKIFLVACVFYVAYVVAGFMVKVPWHDVGASVIKPRITPSRDYLLMAISVVGTTIAPWMQFYQQAAVAEKGIQIKDYGYSRVDTIAGSITVNVIAFFIIMLCGTMLFTGIGGHPIQTAADAARALLPLAGKYCALLFAFGLLNASLFAASILPLSTAYTVCESFGWESGVNKRFAEAPQFYALYSLLIVAGAVVVLFPGIPLIRVMWFSQLVNGIVLPVVLVIMVILVNDRRIMGEYVNKPLGNVLTVLTIVAVSALSLALAGTSIWSAVIGSG
jgi:NRAMP (natural resistance-associated macrophage protein)-like metal ion transporter